MPSKIKEREALKSEAEMCSRFISIIPPEWIVYPETGGFDMLLVRKDDGFQIGVEAKLKLNAKVISQAEEERSSYSVLRPGPDCRAVLVPEDCGMDLMYLCGLLGLEVIKFKPKYSEEYATEYFGRHRIGSGFKDSFYPQLPSIRETNNSDEWYEFAPNERISLPEMIPDCGAGNPAPLTLTYWKIQSMKICITDLKRGFVTRTDFKYFNVSMPRWTQFGLAAWLKNNGDGTFNITDRAPDFKKQHPKNWEELLEKYDEWKRDFVSVETEKTKKAAKK